MGVANILFSAVLATVDQSLTNSASQRNKAPQWRRRSDSHSSGSTFHLGVGSAGLGSQRRER